MMAERLVKNLVSNLPPDVLEKITGIFGNVVTFKKQLDRIEQNQQLIMAALNIQAHAQPQEQLNGPEHRETS